MLNPDLTASVLTERHYNPHPLMVNLENSGLLGLAVGVSGYEGVRAAKSYAHPHIRKPFMQNLKDE
jgi:hypothetical protein